jgi:speckle-type POZ protein
MFQHLMKENLTNRIVMEDIEPDVFGVLLPFIYTSPVSLSEMDTFTVGLYADADK